MKRILLSLAGLGALVACGPATLGMAGLATQPVLQDGFGHVGTSVVCLGSDIEDRAWEFQQDGAWSIDGRVVYDQAETAQIGNVDPCWSAPSRVLVIEDEQGITWAVGYRWQSRSLGDVTPSIEVQPGDEVTLTYRPGAEAGSAGFVVTERETQALAYAMESGRGGRALLDDDVPGVRVSTGDQVGFNATDECGDETAVTLRFSTDDGDEEELPPGGDAQLEVGDEDHTLCNINSFEVSGSDCGQIEEKSWIVF